MDDSSATYETKAYSTSMEKNETPHCGADPKRDDLQNKVVMESGGTTDYDSPNYVEEDDVKDSIAEGYF